jgi:methylated-DNA-[protein]-cysteine S-methyltransferase
MKTTSIPVQQTIHSAWGPLLLAATPHGLCGMWFDGQKHSPDASAWPVAPSPFIDQARQQLADYFAGQRSTFDLPLDLSAGTAFQQAVWHALLAIPCGQVVSYGSIAKGMGKPAAVRAVGAAVGRNPVGIIVPCHRVLGATGALTGYAGGLERKKALLQLENAAALRPELVLTA